MFIQFRSPYRDEQTGQYIKSPGVIAIQYFKGWFFLDFISVLPFELLGFMSAGGGVADLKILRVVRLARLLKLLRVLRASRKLRKWQVYANLRYASLQILQVSHILFI
jgi:hypothetical protein